MRTLANVLKDFYEHEPERVAITLQHPDQPDFHITYRELMDRSNDYAAAFARAGIEPGDMVILILQHGKDVVYSFWGAVLLGAIPSIMSFLTEKLSPDRYHHDMQALFSFSHPAAVVTYPEFEPNCRQMVSESHNDVPVFITDRIPRQETLDLSTLPGLNSQETDIAVIQHSSGTTGLQKGIALSHQAIFNQLDPLVKVATGLVRQDVLVSWLPLYHDMGLIACFLMPILNGVHVIQMSPFDWVREPWRLLRAVSDYRATITFLPNFAYNFCANKIRERDIEGIDLSSWRVCFNGGEPAKFKSHKMFYERFKTYGLSLETLQIGYGMAETVFAATSTLSYPLKPPYVEEIDRKLFISEHLARPAFSGRPSIQMMSSGKPLPNTDIRILDANARDLPDRHVGEIVLKSNCMFSEYYHRPELTARAFTTDGWFKSGDYGYRFNGEVFVAGRAKDTIIVAGKNVYPQDLEQIVDEVPGVHPGRTAAIGLYDESQGTEAVVIVAEVDTQDEDEQERIADEVRNHVTRNSAIAVRRVQVVEAQWIIKTSSGKAARAANKEKYIREFNDGQETIG